MAGDEGKRPNLSGNSIATSFSDSSSKAKDRISQITSQIAPSPTENDQSSQTPPHTRRRRRTSTKQDGPPADYTDVLSTLQHLRHLAKNPDPQHPGYARQKIAGKLWVRERVAALFDPDSFREVGSVSGEVAWRQKSPTTEEATAFIPSNNVQGFGRLRGRRIVFTADDFTLRAGHADGALMAKTVYMEKLAIALRLPIIKLVDGSSGGGSVSSIRSMGYSYIPPLESFTHVMKQLNMGIPNLGAVLGPAIGLGAARVVSCHFSVMSADIGALFNAGPKVVANATLEEGLSFTDLGGPMMHCTNGTIDNLAPDEDACFAQLRDVLSYLPNVGTSIPPILSSNDSPDRLSPDLRTSIPRKRERTFDPHRIVALLSATVPTAYPGTSTNCSRGRLKTSQNFR